MVIGYGTTPIADASLELINVSGEGGEYQAKTDVKGQYTVDLPAGQYKIFLHWMGGECSEIRRASFSLSPGAHLTFDFLVMRCPIYVPIISTVPEEEDKRRLRALLPNPMNIPLAEQSEKYQEQIIPKQVGRQPEIVVSFGKYDNQIDKIRYLPLHQLVMDRTPISNAPELLSLPVTITVGRYTLRASAVTLDKGRMIFEASGEVSFSDGVETTTADSATLSFSDGEPRVEVKR